MKILCALFIATVCLVSRTLAADNVIISEFMASNSKTLADEDGFFEDWIEIRNAGTNAVDLGGWYLTDTTNNLTKWQFPSTNLAVGGHLIVFASNKDRRVPGARLHTDFRLTASGEYLALVRPDGTNIATQFAPVFPPQVSDVSYGFGVLTSNLTFVATNAAARVRVPASAADGTNWLYPGFSDSTWTVGTNGVGYGASNIITVDYSAAVLATAPVGYWRLNEATGTTATNRGSGAGLDGTYTGGPTLGGAGPRPPTFTGFEADNNAPAFNGSSAFVATSQSLLSGRGAFSVGGWVNLPVTPGSRIGLFGQNDVCEFGFSSGTTIELWTPGGGSMQVNYPYPLNTWHHVVGVADGNNLKVYLDGVQAGTGGTPTVNYGSSADPFRIGGGGIADASGNFLNGRLDEVFVHHRALSAAEVLSVFSAGTNAGGFSVASVVATDVGSVMSNVNATAYVRLPFTVDVPTNFSQLTLRLRYDDGIVAWLNGVELVRANATDPLAFNSAATNAHSAATVEEIRFGSDLLVAGTNVLAIQGLNVAANDGDFFVQAELIGTSVPVESPFPVFFTTPTPGVANSGGANTPGPAITDTLSAPNVPKDYEDLLLTARATATANPVAGVVLRYRIMFDSEIEVAMYDDGAHGDGGTNDGVFGATIPASASTNGQMIRWYFRATDTGSNVTRWPAFVSTANSAEYFGTIVDPTNVTSRLPIMHIFAPPTVLQPGPTTTQTGADSQLGGRVSFFHDGEFYDNVYMALRGNSTAGFNKKSHRIGFNHEHLLRHPGPGGRIGNTGFVADYPDPTYMRQRLSFWLGNAFGLPSPFYYPVRLQLNGQFYQLANHNNVNGDELAAFLGLDPEGAYYKAVGQLTTGLASTGGFEKLIPRGTPNTDYLELAAGLAETNSTGRRLTNMLDMLNLPEVINYCAVARWVHENDDVWANMTLQRDTYGTKEWRIIPFDLNLSWGAIFYEGADTTVVEGVQSTNDQHKAFPLYGSSQALALSGPGGGYNRMYDSIFTVPRTREMVLRRLRTLMDTFIKPPGTPTNELLIEPMLLAWRNELADEATRDRAKWAWPPRGGQCNFDPGINLTNGVNALITDFIGARRRHLYGKHSVTNTVLAIGIAKAQNAGIPTNQPAYGFVVINRVEFNPTSGNQAQEFICVSNPMPFAVDMSGWKLGGGVDFTFAGGTVLTTNSVLYVSPNTAAFRTRTVSPRGGEANYVVGPFNGQLSARGEPLFLTDARGLLISSNGYAGSPSPAQQYLRVSEIMYHPAPPASGPYLADDFEYLELKNISPATTLSLLGLRFTNGVDFTFTGSAVTNLAAGQTVVIVRNTNAFSSRYGVLPNVAGQFVGQLDNAGERIQINDTSNEEVLDFNYNNTWYPTTDGLGFSLVVVDENAAPDAWNNKSQWRPSGALDGSPGTVEPAPSTIAPILINEVLSRSDVPPPTDSIELYNSTTNDVNIGGWYLTDDFNTPKKFRIPNDTVISNGGYRVFAEADFNPTPGTPPSFALSSDGDEVWLFSADGAGNLTGYFHGFDFGGADDGVTFGRYVTSDGREHFPAQSSSTLGGVNSGPRVGPVVIDEVMYHPPDLGTNDNTLDEYIELLNIASTNVPLYDVTTPTNTWKLTGGANFTFPTNASINPGEFVLLVNFDPATNTAAVIAFRAKFHVDAGVQLFGPYAGKLDNNSDNLELQRPTTPVADLVDYVQMDKVSYEDHTPWPAAADGTGPSLQRKDASAYGDDPANWIAAFPTAAAATPTGGAVPVLTLQPAGQSILAYQNTTFSVTATGTGPFQYQWNFNGANLAGATNSVLQLNNVQLEQSGLYQVLVFNAAGAVLSSNAQLSVRLPATIFSQPQNQQARPTSNATFSVIALSPSPLRYQWRFNGLDIANATSASLTVSNVALSNVGSYRVAIADDFGTVESDSATLTVLINPTIVQQPLSQNVVTNGTVVLSIGVTNTATLPVWFRWRRGGTTVTNYPLNAYNAFFTVTNVNAGVSSATANTNWTVIVTNSANASAANLSSNAFLTILADTDGDGLTDSWMMQYFGHTNGLAGDLSRPGDDADGDGSTNAQEYIAGTNPKDNTSYLKVEEISSGVNLRFNAVSNRTYSVQFKTNLNDIAWQKILDLAARNTNWSASIPDPNPGLNHRVYRLVTPSQP